MTDQRLGRVPSPADPRDADYPFAKALPPVAPPTYRYWVPNARLDQRATPNCVGYASAHLISGSPVRVHGMTNAHGDALYRLCKEVDGYPGDGTWVRVAASVMRRDGLIAEYLWAQSMDDLVRWVLTKGPVVVGTAWTDQMFTPDSRGFIHPEGEIVGGHAYLIDGINVRAGKARLLNSWGPGWGRKGQAWIGLADLESLVFSLNGEAMAATEVAR